MHTCVFPHIVEKDRIGFAFICEQCDKTWQLFTDGWHEVTPPTPDDRIVDGYIAAPVEEISVKALADQIALIAELTADTNAKVTATQATVAQLAEVLKQFAEVNPQELMGMLGQMIK